jgi:hypothetical protein
LPSPGDRIEQWRRGIYGKHSILCAGAIGKCCDHSVIYSIVNGVIEIHFNDITNKSSMIEI